MKKTFALALLAASTTYAAADGAWYAGGDVGSTKLSSDGGSDNRTGFGAFAGYKLNQNVAFELAARRLGSASDTEQYGGYSVKTEVKLDAFQASVLGILPLSDAVSLYGRLGVGNNAIDASGSTSGVTVNASGNNTVALFGVGVNLQISKNIALRGEYTDLGSNDLTIVGTPISFKAQQVNVGMTYTF